LKYAVFSKIKLENITIYSMDHELLAFFAGVGFLLIYLVFSAWTEMGTKLPWKK
jgi:hypothetical protein